MNDWKNEVTMDEDLSNIIVLQDENGDDVEFEFLDLIVYNDEEYVVLLPMDDFDDEVVILQVAESENEDEEQYLSVEDDKMLNEVFQIFKAKFRDQFNFTDSE